MAETVGELKGYGRVGSNPSRVTPTQSVLERGWRASNTNGELPGFNTRRFEGALRMATTQPRVTCAVYAGCTQAAV